MTIEIERNGTHYFAHTAWMDDEQGTNFSLEEPEESIYVGNYVDTSSEESTDYRRYAWRQTEDIQEGELSQEDIYDDMSEFIEGSDSEYKEDLAITQNHIDTSVGKKNLLDGADDIGLWGTTDTSHVITKITETEDDGSTAVTNGIRVTCNTAGSASLFMEVGELRDILGAAEVDNTFTISADIRMSTMFHCDVAVSNADGSEKQLEFAQIDGTPLNTDNSMNDEWFSYVSTGNALGATSSGQNLYISLTDMPSGATLDIMNMKIEEGAEKTNDELIKKKFLVQEINMSGETIRLTGNRFIVEADNLRVEENGMTTMKNATIYGKMMAYTEKSTYIQKEGTVEVGGLGIRICDGRPDAFNWIGTPGIAGSAGGSKGSSLCASQDSIILRRRNEGDSNTSSAIEINNATDDYNTYISVKNPKFNFKVSESGIDFGEGTEKNFTVSPTGAVKGHSIAPLETGKYGCGLKDERWSTVYTEDLNASGVSHLDGQVWMNGVADENFQAMQTYAANMYIGASGRVWKTSNTSSNTKKHDIFPLEDEDISAERLLDVQVVQAKYNEGVLSESDQRYMKNMPMFIIEDLYDKYPIAVDIPDGDIKNASWNERFLLPPMLKLIQEQDKRIKKLEKIMIEMKNGMQ